MTTIAMHPDSQRNPPLLREERVPSKMVLGIKIQQMKIWAQEWVATPITLMGRNLNPLSLLLMENPTEALEKIDALATHALWRGCERGIRDTGKKGEFNQKLNEVLLQASNLRERLTKVSFVELEEIFKQVQKKIAKGIDNPTDENCIYRDVLDFFELMRAFSTQIDLRDFTGPCFIAVCAKMTELSQSASALEDLQECQYAHSELVELLNRVHELTKSMRNTPFSSPELESLQTLCDRVRNTLGARAPTTVSLQQAINKIRDLPKDLEQNGTIWDQLLEETSIWAQTKGSEFDKALKEDIAQIDETVLAILLKIEEVRDLLAFLH
jgi:hypothetical protein